MICLETNLKITCSCVFVNLYCYDCVLPLNLNLSCFMLLNDTLLLGCNDLFLQLLDTLLGTLVKELQNKYTPGRREEAIAVTMRFLRSVARVFVILSVEMASSKKKK